MNEFSDNAGRSRFEYQIDGSVTFADYRRENGVLYIDYVEAPPALRGTGAAGKLMEYIVTRAREEDLQIVPICGYAAAWLRRHSGSSAAAR